MLFMISLLFGSEPPENARHAEFVELGGSYGAMKKFEKNRKCYKSDAPTELGNQQRIHCL